MTNAFWRGLLRGNVLIADTIEKVMTPKGWAVVVPTDGDGVSSAIVVFYNSFTFEAFNNYGAMGENLTQLRQALVHGFTAPQLEGKA